MNKTFEVDLSQQYTVEFKDAEKVIAYFIDGEWSDVFWDLDDLEDLIDSLILAFNMTDTDFHYEEAGESYYYKTIEGFPTFIQKRDDAGVYFESSQECAEELGTIIVRETSELFVYFCTEVET